MSQHSSFGVRTHAQTLYQARKLERAISGANTTSVDSPEVLQEYVVERDELLPKFLTNDNPVTYRVLRTMPALRRRLAHHVASTDPESVNLENPSAVHRLLFADDGPIPGTFLVRDLPAIDLARVRSRGPLDVYLSWQNVGYASGNIASLIRIEYGDPAQDPIAGSGLPRPEPNAYIFSSPTAKDDFSLEAHAYMYGRLFAQRFDDLSRSSSRSVLQLAEEDAPLRDVWAWVVGGRPWLQEMLHDKSPAALQWLEGSPAFHVDHDQGPTSGLSEDDLSAAVEELDEYDQLSSLRTESLFRHAPGRSGTRRSSFGGANRFWATPPGDSGAQPGSSLEL